MLPATLQIRLTSETDDFVCRWGVLSLLGRLVWLVFCLRQFLLSTLNIWSKQVFERFFENSILTENQSALNSTFPDNLVTKKFSLQAAEKQRKQHGEKDFPHETEKNSPQYVNDNLLRKENDKWSRFRMWREGSWVGLIYVQGGRKVCFDSNDEVRWARRPEKEGGKDGKCFISLSRCCSHDWRFVVFLFCFCTTLRTLLKLCE